MDPQGRQRKGYSDERVKSCGLSIRAKKGEKEEPEGKAISSFAVCVEALQVWWNMGGHLVS